MRAMATTKNLADLMDREMGKGQGPFLVRISQDAGLLPKVRSGGWRYMAQLTAEHLADFVIVVAGTRAVGARNANGARTAIERFSGLVSVADDKIVLRDALTALIRDGVPDDTVVLWALFVNHPDCPEVEMRLYDDATGEQSVRNYNDPSNALPAGVAEASMIYGGLIHALHELVTESEPVAVEEDTAA